jgi:SAM-dependent methyltransferase
LTLDRHAPLSPEDVDTARVWPRARRLAAEVMWGDSCIGPGGVDYTVDLAAALDPKPNRAFLELTSGLGGGTRAIANAFGIHVTGTDGDPDLANEGHARSLALQMDRRAGIRAVHLDGIELRAGAFDQVLAREAFHQVVDKARLFRAVALGMKIGGLFLFTDFVLTGRGPMSPAMQRWSATERTPPFPVTPDEICGHLARDFRVVAVDDVTKRYRAMILAGMMQVAGALKGRRVPGPLTPWVSREVEFWARRVALFERRELAVHRFLAERSDRPT